MSDPKVSAGGEQATGPSYDEQVRYLADWAVRNDCQFKLEGEVGFGRECVGMLRGNSYLDYSHLWQEMPGEEFWWPQNAYHKHDCMAVLGRGPDAVRELYDWAKWLDEHGWTTQDVDALLHGLSTPRLVKRAARNEVAP